MDGILATCDHAIEAGEGFDKFYTSTFENTIRPGQGDGLKADLVALLEGSAMTVSGSYHVPIERDLA